MFSPPLPRPDRPRITTFIHQVPLPLGEGMDRPWQPFNFFQGATPVVDEMESHASILMPGHSPHPPHAHGEEELLIAIEGEAETIISDGPTLEGARSERLQPGDFAYYPPFQHHTIRNSHHSKITYLMFKWRTALAPPAGPLKTSVIRLGGVTARVEAEPFHARLLFEQPTAYLAKLHSHVSDLQPGAGYEPHADPYDVAIVVLAGKIETLGRVVEPLGVIFYAAGELHGMRNVGEEPARYLVFEFHGD